MTRVPALRCNVVASGWEPMCGGPIYHVDCCTAAATPPAPHASRTIGQGSLNAAL